MRVAVVCTVTMLFVLFVLACRDTPTTTPPATTTTLAHATPPASTATTGDAGCAVACGASPDAGCCPAGARCCYEGVAAALNCYAGPGDCPMRP